MAVKTRNTKNYTIKPTPLFMHTTRCLTINYQAGSMAKTTAETIGLVPVSRIEIAIEAHTKFIRKHRGLNNNTQKQNVCITAETKLNTAVVRRGYVNHG